MSNRRYNEAIGRHFWRPASPRGQVFSGMAGSVERGTVIDFWVGLSDKKYACPHIIAACSLMADHLEGQPAERLTDPGLPDVLKELEIPVEKAGKILILQDALRACYVQLGSLAGAQAD